MYMHNVAVLLNPASSVHFVKEIVAFLFVVWERKLKREI
jgi:hypothetical protein